MRSQPNRRPAILMLGYTYYESDPRVIREAEAALEGGFEVDFLALRRPGTPTVESVHGICVYRLNQSKYRGSGHAKYVLAYLQFFLRCLVKTSLLFLRKQYGVIHVNNMPDFLVFCTILPRLFGTKVILDIHDPMPDTFVSKFKGGKGGFFYHLLLWQERLSAAYSSRVITVHHPVRDGILAKHGLACDSVGVIANFPDGGLFPLRTRFQIDGTIHLVFHGTILERAGLRMLMTALAQVRQKDRVHVTIIGEGDFSTALKELIKSLNLGRMVTFDDHSYPAHSISSRIAECNVGLVPLEISAITNYALPLKLLEYLSLGLPVLSVRNEAIAYYLEEEDCMFFQWDEPASLAAAIDHMAENPSILLRYRERSVALRERLSWSGEKLKYVAMLRQLSGGLPVIAVS